MFRRIVVFVFASSLFASGCATFIDRTVDTAANTAGQKVGEDLGNRMADQILADLGPANLHSYTMALFQLNFYHGGYNLSVRDYEPGDYTHWRATNSQYGDEFEKVLLKRRDDGAEWWRFTSTTTRDGETQTFISEALIEAPDERNRRKILRMRVKYPDEKKPTEVPVTEENSDEWILSSQRTLTKESRKGLRVGRESLSTPAGTFETEHLQTSSGQATVNWWLTDDVPGRVVKYNQQLEEKDEPQYEVVLTDYGSGMTSSKLGTFEN